MEIKRLLTENILRNVIETAPFPIGVYAGYELEILLANKCMRDTYGKGEDVVGKRYTEILPELENQEIFEQLRDVISSGIPFEAKDTRVDIVKDGLLKPHYFNYNFTPLYNDNGDLFAVMNTAAEVTDLNLSRQQTIEAEERLRLALRSADLGTFETQDIDGTFTASKRFAEICGIEQTQGMQRELLEHVHPEDLKRINEAYIDAENNGQLNYEARIVIPNAKVKWIRVRGTKVKDDKDVGKGVIGIVQDITEQKVFAEKLRKLVKKRTRELKRSNEDLLQFAHVVSHDLKSQSVRSKCLTIYWRANCNLSCRKKANNTLKKCSMLLTVL